MGVWLLKMVGPLGKLTPTKKYYNALRVGKRRIFTDSTGREFVKINGIYYSLLGMEGYTL